MKLQNRIELLLKLREYLIEDSEELKQVKYKAHSENPWFIPEFIHLALKAIIDNFLDPLKLKAWVSHYRLDDIIGGKNIGIVMAGNIPLVGFHDFLCVFISGHHQTIKLSSKDAILLKHFISKLTAWDKDLNESIKLAEMLKGCDAYVATGSNNSGRYFEQYFGKYPNIIRKNRTSVAILTGDESAEELDRLSDDIHSYFGFGCRNVTKIFVPEKYDFVPLLKSFDKYSFFADHNKYKNNYDYQLSLALLNNIYYMTSESTLLIENESLFSPVSQLNYSFYSDKTEVLPLINDSQLQCLVGKGYTPFGMVQQPGLFDYADGVDTIQFLLTL